MLASLCQLTPGAGHVVNWLIWLYLVDMALFLCWSFLLLLFFPKESIQSGILYFNKDLSTIKCLIQQHL
jgi:hypothetical protein